MAEGTADPLAEVDEILDEISENLEQGVAEASAHIAKVDRIFEIDRRLRAYWTEHMELPWRLFLCFLGLAIFFIPLTAFIWTPFVLGVVGFGVLAALSHAWYMHHWLRKQQLEHTLLQESD